MSLSVAGVWQVGVWDQTVWADGVWREGAYVAPEVETTQNTGGWEDYSRHPYLRSVREKEKFIEKQAVLEEQIEHIEVDAAFKYDRQPKAVAALERKLEALREELDGIKVLNALIAEQQIIEKRLESERIKAEMLEEEEAIFMFMMMV